MKFINRVRCYDNGGISADRYTVVFLDTGKKVRENATNYDCLCMSYNPNYPLGVCMHGTAQLPNPIIGDVIPWSDLPTDCQMKVMEDLQI